MENLTCQDLLGKTILVGVTYCTAEGELLEQKQFWGTVIEANENEIDVKQKDGSIFALPPDLRSTKPAEKGEYTLQSTGEVVVDPDFTSVWMVKKDSEEN